MHMFGVVGETHAHHYFELISFYNSKDITLYMCNLHIKETEISQKLSKENQKLKVNLLCYFMCSFK